MNITFLVGNGFDIGAGASTSYSAFYKWYCDQPSENSNISSFKNAIQTDIANGGKNWSDFEIGLGKYTSKFTVETADDFIECFEDAREKIIEYLELEQQKLSDSISEADVRKLKEGIVYFYQDLPTIERNKFAEIFESDKANDTTIQFISFNYTTLLDKCVEMLAKEPLKQWTHTATKYMRVNKAVTHIHGTSNRFPILGVNDPSQIANMEFLAVPQFAELIIKHQGVKTIGELWHTQAMKFIKESQIICIFGMSLGNSDSLWWQQVMSWLKNESSGHLVIFWHTDALQNMHSPYKYAREKAKITNQIANFSDFPADTTKSISERIHVVFNTSKILQVSFEKPKVKVFSGKQFT